MRSSTLIVAAAIVVGCAGAAQAKKMACTPALQMSELARYRIPNPDDRTAPPTPVLRAVMIEDRTLWVDAEFARDTALVEIHVIDANAQPIVLWTQPHITFLCLTETISPGSAVVSVAAHDAAGNASSAVTTTNVLSHRFRNHRRGMGIGMLIVFVPVLAIGAVIGALVIFMMRRGRLRMPGEEISLLVAESITRTILQRNALLFGLGIAAVIVLQLLERWGTSAVVSVIPLTAFTRVYAARRVLAALEQPDAAAVLHGTQLQVGMRDIQASHGLIARAQKQSVPAGFARDV